MAGTTVTLKVDNIVVQLDAYWLRHYAGDYLSAAEQFTPPPNRFSPVRHYLFCHSIELSLKSFLFTVGLKRTDRKKLNHDLQRTLKSAEDRGLGTHVSISTLDRDQIARIDNLYSAKEFEYFESLAMIYDPLPFDPIAIESLAKRLHLGIEAPVRASTIK
ncbi:MAG: hypothetical protein ABI794_07430 [Betaproteobacteria bacterium]